jgi:tRNA(Arg) A34 adenosine deaminase TadA
VDESLDAAVAKAQDGGSEGGIPVGAMLVHEGRIIGRGHNGRVQRDPARRDGRNGERRQAAGGHLQAKRAVHDDVALRNV